MTKAMSILSVHNSLAVATLVAGITMALSAAAQQPSQAEIDAVRSNCRSDYMAKCMSVKPGGIEAIQCLKKNDASLSATCRSAVNAISTARTAPAAAAPAPAAAAPVAAPQPAPPAAPAPKPVEPAAAIQAPAKPAASMPAAAKPVQAKPAAAPKPVVASAPPAAAPIATPAAPSAVPGPKLGPLQEARIVRDSCTVDFQVLCKGVRIGQGRAINCLAANQPALSPNCKQAMAEIGR